MKKTNKQLLILFLLIAVVLPGSLPGSCTPKADREKQSASATEVKKDSVKYKVTFIELGSVRCIPCREMQPIMKSIEEKYGSQVKVVFYDVWTPPGKVMADKYNVQLIPTQVFLDENGKEIFRHEGFFAEKELVEMLKRKGVI